MPLELVRNDIVNMQVDAVVNAANVRLKRGGGVCGAIFAAADGEKLQAACDKIGHCAVGDAVLTRSYGLRASHVIHAVGPVWQDGSQGEEALLRSAYTRALELAQANRLRSVAFPLISAGIYGMPRERAMSCAISAIGDFLMREDMLVYLVLYDRASSALGSQIYAGVRAYIDERYVDEHADFDRCRRAQAERAWQIEQLNQPEPPKTMPPAPQAMKAARQPVWTVGSLEELLGRMQEESFSQLLLRLIDEKGMKDTEVYKRANLDRKLFSKIRGKKDYQPGKNTVLALAVALRLDLGETEALLKRAGFALSPGNKGDLIVEYFIAQGNYNIHQINEALFEFDERTLGAQG